MATTLNHPRVIHDPTRDPSEEADLHPTMTGEQPTPTQDFNHRFPVALAELREIMNRDRNGHIVPLDCMPLLAGALEYLTHNRDRGVNLPNVAQALTHALFTTDDPTSITDLAGFLVAATMEDTTVYSSLSLDDAWVRMNWVRVNVRGLDPIPEHPVP